ncbi:site-specific DNA-methyltransferase [Haloferula sargassicola]|uniref:site-specific DNA-methyltransferase n=1 Tax=Haloferula sargassicola TaxID=490096 RepID=UPI003365A7F0
MPFRLLEPDPERSHGDPDEGNLIVQGDNLHALKALLPKYAGRVKCIYIDPPYNTGKEGWIYNDNVNAPEILKWLGQTVGKEAEDLSRHDKWLCMMYPRLVLLKQFLSEDGAIFVSIDDNEVSALRMLMDEIFRVKNHLATFTWRTDGNFDNQAKIKVSHEYIVAYARDADAFVHPAVVDPSIQDHSKLFRPEIRNTIVKNGPKNPVSAIDLPSGFPCAVEEGAIEEASNDWPKFSNAVTIRDFKTINPVSVSSGWSSKRQIEEFIARGMVAVPDSKGQMTTFEMTKTGAIESVKKRETPSHVISTLSGFSSTQNMARRLEAMGFKFDYPKPVELVAYLISLVSEGGIILDSFAGSGTTGHAVLKQNAEDGGTRKFILVEMEPNIAEDITAERVKRVSQGYTDAKGNQVEGLGGGFQFCRLSDEPLFNEFGDIRDDVTFAQLADFLWFSEAGTGYTGKGDSPLLGVHEGRAVYLLFNGILGDRRPQGGNILTNAILEALPPHDGPKIIYAAATKLGAAALQRANVVSPKMCSARRRRASIWNARDGIRNRRRLPTS